MVTFNKHVSESPIVTEMVDVLRRRLESVVSRRRWRQLSIRSLVVLITILCVWMAFEVSHAQRQRVAVEALLRAGASVTYDHELDANDVPITNPTPPGPLWLRRLVGGEYFDIVHSVSLRGTMPATATDSILKNVRNLHDLQYLDLTNTGVTDNGLDLGWTQVTDDGLIHLRQMKELRYLNLGWTQVTDEGVRHLEDLTNIEQLMLNDTLVTDSCLKHLRNMRKLDYLVLSGCKITDEALPALHALPSLRILQLRRTNVTQAGVDALKEALPGCAVTW